MSEQQAELWRATAQLLFDEALVRDGTSRRMFYPSEEDIPNNMWLAALILFLAEAMDLDESVAWVASAWQHPIELRPDGLEPVEIADFMLRESLGDPDPSTDHSRITDGGRHA